MKTVLKNIEYIDPAPARISAGEWHDIFKNIPDEFIDEYRYYREYGKNEWNNYLQPPSTFQIYGGKYMRKLKFDNSLASLRLWGFMMNESERLFRAKQSGKNIIATMGDLGAIPPLVYSFKDTIPFYPDCYWWTPFLNESNVLFDEAKKLGIGEDCCFVRAALGAFSKMAYFPKPDIGIATTGATCDDMSSVMQGIERLGHNLHWFELPHRKDRHSRFKSETFSTTSAGVEYQNYLEEFLIKEYKNLIPEIEKISGLKYNEDQLSAIIKKTNHLRTLVREIKDIVFSAEIFPLPALEMMSIDFITLSAYSDLDEAIYVLEHIKDTVQDRVESNTGITDPEAVRVLWVTPPADPLLLNYLEDLGGRLTGCEFVINQALHPLNEDIDPIEALAEGMINSSLIGTTKARTKEILNQAEKYNAEGVIISSIFASSHCAYETHLIKEEIRNNLNIPVLAYDVVAPGKQQMQSQILNRMAAFMELLKDKRKINGRKAYTA